MRKASILLSYKILIDSVSWFYTNKLRDGEFTRLTRFINSFMSITEPQCKTI